MEYPKAKKVDVVDDYHGTKVADPYRWLEDVDSAETKAWVKAQKELTEKYLGQIPYRKNIRKRLKEIHEIPQYVERFGWDVVQFGDLYFFKKPGINGDSTKIYLQHGETGTEELLLDTKDVTTSEFDFVFVCDVSRDHKYVLFGICRFGSDKTDFRVMDFETKEILTDRIDDTKPPVSCLWNEGVFYSKRDIKNSNEDGLDNLRLFYHKLGTPNTEDVLVFDSSNLKTNQEKKIIWLYGRLFDEGNLVIFSLTDIKEYYLIRLKDGKIGKPEHIVSNDSDTSYWITGIIDNKLIVSITENGSNSKIVTIDIDNKKNIHEIIPDKNVKHYNWVSCGYIYINYYIDLEFEIHQFDSSGNFIRKIITPEGSAVELSSGFHTNKKTLICIKSFFSPNQFYLQDPNTGEMKLLRGDETSNDKDILLTKKTYESFDDTNVPITLMHNKDIKLDGNNPVILYAYGGYGSIITPSFNTWMKMWIELGFIVAIAGIRGGGEYGESWHNAGKRENMQNSINDCIWAIDFLIKEGYSKNEKTATHGYSNGGITMGAVLNQAPEKIGVSVPGAGIYDMIKRDHLSSSIEEFGTSDDPDQFKYLYAYSPYHNVKNETVYPPTLVMASEHDDRVFPFHSYKFVARLQEAQASENPILLHSISGGHSFTTKDERVKELADMISFMLWNMGIKELNSF